MTAYAPQIRDLFLAGHTVEDVITAGDAGGWGLNDVADLIQEHGWVVDEDSMVHMPLEPGGCQCVAAQQELRSDRKAAHVRTGPRAAGGCS